MNYNKTSKDNASEIIYWQCSNGYNDTAGKLNDLASAKTALGRMVTIFIMVLGIVVCVFFTITVPICAKCLKKK